MGATERRRRHPFWQRPKTRNFFRLAWPALGAWLLTAVLVADLEGLDTLPHLVQRCFAYTLFLSYMASMPYIFVAAAANGPVRIRALACASNASVGGLIMAGIAEDETARGSTEHWTLFAAVACAVVVVAVMLCLSSGAHLRKSENG